jgi:ABC-type transport system involved in cytochrome c biogenesis permease subunit
MLLGDTPRFGFAPALSVTAWLVLTVYAVERQLFPQLQARWALAGLGAAAVLLALVFPGTPLHVSRFALAAAALGAGHRVLRPVRGRRGARLADAARERTIRQAAEPSGLPLLTLERLTFRFAAPASCCCRPRCWPAPSSPKYCTAAAWRWDHKTVFSVLSWAAFALLLLGRARFGWRGRTRHARALHRLLLLLLAYVGSRFVLEVSWAHRMKVPA